MTQAYYPFYWSDYSGKTMHLTQGQHGAFMMLMRWIYTTEKPVPDKQRYSIARAMSEQERSDTDAVLEEFFFRDGEMWRQDKCEHIIAKANEQHQRRVNAGKNGGLAKSKNAKQSPSNARAMPKQPEPEPNNIDTNVSIPPTPKGLPAWLPVTDWKDFCQMRGAKFTARAKQLIIGKLDKLREQGHDPAAVLQQSLERGWSGVFEIKGDYNGTRQISSGNAFAGNAGATGEPKGNGFGGRKSQTQLASEETERIIRERRAAWAANGGKNPNQGLFGKPRAAEPPVAAMLPDAEEIR
ncbi:DUF1376 domain-containing protein [Hymenobacter sp. BT186]|uniref:DUF1376 domain-containing protein n=1 Tax=Hymenobacter telluris TaxID=2816474 RepID=A0A939EXV4_9BACT|nr:DUF1376 domain-containing protein [Hymenobacter telluris]MBO0358612.1 DUF1376 domain-containing protein [Hymenobacter telluris]MBW3374638.1 DUF1376 domain-containing protein [Hymenobacter norwichensis]